MRCSGDSPVKTRIRKRKRVRKKRFTVMLIFTLVMAYFISYDIVKKNTSESISSYGEQKTYANESIGKNSGDYSNLLVNDGMVDEEADEHENAGADSADSAESAELTEEVGGNIVPNSLDLGGTLLANKDLMVSPKYAVLVRSLQNYLKGMDGKYGVYFLNLKDGSEFGINHKDKFTAASTIKIPINLYLFKKIKEGSINPKYILTYKRNDYETGTGIIQKSPFGKKYTVRELSRLSIEISDNVATNMLLRLLDIVNVKDYMRQLGCTVVVDNQNVTCPKDMGIYMRRVYSFYNEDRVLGKELMGYYLNTSSSDRIPALLPKSVKVAHKIGNQVNTMNDVGIVFAREPYIVSILSKDVDEAVAVGVIANISRKIYDFIE